MEMAYTNSEMVPPVAVMPIVPLPFELSYPASAAVQGTVALTAPVRTMLQFEVVVPLPVPAPRSAVVPPQPTAATSAAIKIAFMSPSKGVAHVAPHPLTRKNREMGLTKLLVLVLGLAAIAFAVKYELEGSMRSRPSAHTVPKQQLDNVRDKAHDLERQLQKAADDAARNTDQR
jgi:hypothetical protein